MALRRDLFSDPNGIISFDDLPSDFSSLSDELSESGVENDGNKNEECKTFKF